MPIFRRSLILMALLSLPTAAQQESPSELTFKVDPKDKFKIDKAAEPFKSIRDNAPFAWTLRAIENMPTTIVDISMEETAYDFLLKHASTFTNAEFEAYARRDVTFQDLVGAGRVSFKLDVVYLEGRLRRLRKVDSTRYLKDNGIETVYEAWMFPKGEANPVCIFLTELPPGVEPQKDLNKEMPNLWIGVAGYSFKLAQYDQQRLEAGSAAGRHVRWAAPAFIAKSFTVIAEPSDVADGGASWRSTFAPIVIFGFAAVALALIGLALWYRRGDRAVLDSTAGIRNKNPFENVQE